MYAGYIAGQILLGGGFIKRRHRYEDLVDVTIAEAVVRDAALTTT